MEKPRKGHIVMTPLSRTEKQTVLLIERQEAPNTLSDKTHVAGGDHQGIVINKEVKSGENKCPAQLSLEFRVYLVSGQTGQHSQESRILDFWFAAGLQEGEQATAAQEFFRELVSPQDFPRDYVGFIKRVMKLLQHSHDAIERIAVTLRILDPTLHSNTRPLSADESQLTAPVLTADKLVELIESAYPNPVLVDELARENGWAAEAVSALLVDLQAKGLVRCVEQGAFTRAGQGDALLQVVKQMPKMVSAKQPTIAIITAQYCEKLAVDAMMENKETFVRYTTVGPVATRQLPGGRGGTTGNRRRFGESNVYTLGNMGAHRIVCTKLPTVGHSREAVTAAGNTTTRLLGTFQKVDYVLLVGVGGGVPHYTDFNKHVRLGDVVVSHPANGKKFTYVYCENATPLPDGSFEFETKEFSPVNTKLQERVGHLLAQEERALWQEHLERGLEALSGAEHDFGPPPAHSDKLYVALGEGDMIEVCHPSGASGAQEPEALSEPRPRRVHLAPVAAGRSVARDDRLRQSFAAHVGAKAFDCEFDAVVEAVLGSCRDAFLCVRGIADYKDGTRRRDWQPHAALAAAAVAKAVVCALDPPDAS